MATILRRYFLIGLAFVLALTLTACNPHDFKTAAAQVPQIIDVNLSDPKTFNYALNNESPNVFGFIYEGLLSENSITGELEPALAESWIIAPDKKKITFTLRPGLLWSDGQPLTVDDVVFSYREIFLNPKIPSDIIDILKIGKEGKLPEVRKVDDRRVEFTTPEPFAPFLRNTGLAILPAHILREAVQTTDAEGKPRFVTMWGTDTDPKQIVCNGPYTIDSYSTSQQVVFRRNPNYWRKDAQGKAMPYVERVVWRLVENRDTQLLKFRSGDIDIVEPLRPEDFTLLKREEKRGKFTIYMGGPRPITAFMTFNQNQGKREGKPLVDPIKSKWFNNLAFRQAAAYGIDRAKMINTIYRGLGFMGHSPLIPQSPYYLSPEQGLKTYDYDPEKAKQLLISAGFKYNEQGQLFDAAGHPVKFTLMTNAGNTIRELVIAQIAVDLSKIGMQVTAQPINFGVLLDKIDNSLDWEAYMLAWGGGGFEPYSGFNIWSTDGGSHTFNQKPKAGGKPLEGRVVTDWEKEIEQLYIKGSQELDEAKRKEIFGKSQQVTQEHVPFIWLVNERIMAAVRDRIQGVQYPELGNPLWNLPELRVTD
jgi:peptide/nickel transport system substrate-binding protein